MGIPLKVGFRPQLIVAFGLSVGIPSTVGSRHNLLLSSAFRWESLQWWDLGFHGAIGYHGALHVLYFLIMEL
jgi:hypothetical protein